MQLAYGKGMRYARLLHDYDWMGYKSRTLTPGWYLFSNTPETVPFKIGMSDGAPKDDIKLTTPWEKYIAGVNPKAGYRFIMIPKSGWLNKNDLADTLGFAGNVIEVINEERGFARVKAFDVAARPPNADDWNYETHPELVHKFTVITAKGGVQNPSSGLDSYNILIGKRPLYVGLERIEYFPRLPFAATVKATTVPWLRLREAPDAKAAVVDKLLPLAETQILEYAPRGNDVWGRTEKGWLALMLYRGSWPSYYTTWRMSTLPPLPPRMTRLM